MPRSEKDGFLFQFSGHGCSIVDPPRDHAASSLTPVEDMKLGDKYVVWDGINEKPFTEDKIGHLCIIAVDGELISISEMLAIAHKNPLIVPIIVLSCKNGQSSTEKELGGKIGGVFTYFFCALYRRDPMVTFRDAISLVNIDMQQEGLEQRAEVICRTDILDMPMGDVSLPNEVPLIMIMDMCRTEMTLAEIEKAFKRRGPV